MYCFLNTLQGPAGDRLVKRLSIINFDYEISSALRWEINQSMKRFEDYNYIKTPNYDFNKIKDYESFYSKELNTNNKVG